MKVEAYLVPEHARIEVLPRHFGRHMLTVERRIYGFMWLRQIIRERTALLNR